MRGSAVGLIIVGAIISASLLIAGLESAALPKAALAVLRAPGNIYTESYLRRLEAAVASNPIRFHGDPYEYFADKAGALSPAPVGTVCAIKYIDAAKSKYRILEYTSVVEAKIDGAHVTHTGRCGTCSTLQDLAVYLRERDLTTPVRLCGMISAVQPWAMQCLKRIGFTDACAETWYYNVKHTAKMCWLTCILSWVNGEPSNRPDGSLNSCLACDETQSGPVFKHVAGRTRRNSGVISSIGRTNNEISPIIHDY